MFFICKMLLIYHLEIQKFSNFLVVKGLSLYKSQQNFIFFFINTQKLMNELFHVEKVTRKCSLELPLKFQSEIP